MKYQSLIVLSLAFSLPARGAEPLVDAKKFDRPIRVACVGDSITLGRGSSAGAASYPAQLGRMLGPKFEVRNFGSGGAAALKLGGKPRSYRARPEFKAALAFEPDVVILQFGANDAVSDWPANGMDFAGDYASLIAAFAELPTKPKIVMAELIPVSARYRFTGSEEKARGEIAGLLPKVAKDAGVPLVKLLSPADLKPTTMFDGIHPDAEGSGLMAKSAHRVLTGRDFVGALPVPAPK